MVFACLGPDQLHDSAALPAPPPSIPVCTNDDAGPRPEPTQRGNMGGRSIALVVVGAVFPVVLPILISLSRVTLAMIDAARDRRAPRVTVNQGHLRELAACDSALATNHDVFRNNSPRHQLHAGGPSIPAG